MTTRTKTPTNVSKQQTDSSQGGAAVPRPRYLRHAMYRSFKLQPRLKNSVGPALPGGFRLFRQGVRLLKQHWRVFLILVLIYGLVDFVFVRGMSPGQDYSNIKSTLNGLFGGGAAHVVSGLALFLYMVGSSTQTSSAAVAANPYQFVWVLIMSLALIWTLRQLYAGHSVRVRDSFYRGMYPLITFLLVLFVIAAESIPAILGGVLYAVTSNGVATTAVEQFMWATLFGLLTLLSLYMIVASLFALYIVCLPDMTPVKALRSAHQLVVGRRWAVLRKVLFLPLAMLLLGGIVMVPVILVLPAAASWAFFLIGLFVLPLLHSYYYALYRALLE